MSSFNSDHQILLFLMQNDHFRYLKDSDYYLRRITERQKEDKVMFKRGSSHGRCLCFGTTNTQKASPGKNETPITVTWKIR